LMSDTQTPDAAEATGPSLVLSCQIFIAVRKEWTRLRDALHNRTLHTATTQDEREEMHVLEVVLKQHRLLICKTAARTGVELFWKAQAAAVERFPSCEAGRSVARDLVNNPAFRRLLWPADVGEGEQPNA
jgi:hypothetical protein